MDKKVEGLVKRVRLTEEGIIPLILKYREDCANEGLTCSEDTEFEIVAQAQLNKVLNDEDLALIDKNQTLDKFLKIVGKRYPEFLDVIVADNWKKVIRLAEELKGKE